MYNSLLLSRSSAKDKKKKSKVATHESEGEDGNLAPSDGEDSNVSVIVLFIFHNYEYNLICHPRQNLNCNLFGFLLGMGAECIF